MLDENKNNEFDRLIGTILRDEEETVPPQLWDGVSYKLDRLDHHRLFVLRIKRATVSVLSAAAVIAGILILIPSLNKETNNHQSSVSIAETVKPLERETASESESLVEQIRSSSIRNMVADIPTESIENKDVFITDQRTAHEDVTVDENGFKDEISEKKESDKTQYSEYQASTESSAKVRKQKHVSLFLEGSATSNDIAKANGTGPSFIPEARSLSDGISEKSSSTYGIPLSLGIGVSIGLSDKFSIATGLNYSLLSRSFSGIYTEKDASGYVSRSINSEINNELHYIGIPLNLYYNILSNKNIKFYVWGGGSIEKGLGNVFHIKNNQDDIHYTENINGVQLSSALGLGLEFKLGNTLGLYIDPSARYYFDCNQPTSVRTQKPFMLNFDVGLRVNL